MKKSYHVYAQDGFELATSSLKVAIREAKKGVRRRGVLYTVVRCDLYGMTGGGRGTQIWPVDVSIECSP